MSEQALGDSSTVVDSAQVAVLVDWLSFTVDPSIEASMIFGKSANIAWEPLPRGLLGYQFQRVWGNVRELWGGQPGMGRHFQISGDGCRQLEESGVVSDWLDFFGDLEVFGAHYSRVDVALDDRAGWLSVDKCQDYFERNAVTSRWLDGSEFRKVRRGKVDVPEVGRTYYFGSATSDVRARVYDKALESKSEGHWVRMEVQFRDKRAQAAVNSILSGGVESIVGVLRGYLEFREPSLDANRSRWAVAHWWERFCQGAAKCRLAISVKAPTLERAYNWLRRQAAPTLAMLAVYHGGDIDFTLGELYSLTVAGAERLKPKHRAMLAAVGVYG